MGDTRRVAQADGRGFSKLLIDHVFGDTPRLRRYATSSAMHHVFGDTPQPNTGQDGEGKPRASLVPFMFSTRDG
ncbi:hypothetical protein PRIPAC_90214 [Pristionchus pacificus]|uniref:Uncharacterized protein n=1 Tax=Pristionchus pacificus TaxID=54126 RepID=A0A2A6B6B4_PRIPA|nr:hypothetical protein PRIPAC_90214 [Pristionchus pacificus]|eukprot:PDM61422.1 hypothetical protein PRIPAC_50864 [Pristionchus pacificus]